MGSPEEMKTEHKLTIRWYYRLTANLGEGVIILLGLYVFYSPLLFEIHRKIIEGKIQV